jgi:hypothetical protein
VSDVVEFPRVHDSVLQRPNSNIRWKIFLLFLYYNKKAENADF